MEYAKDEVFQIRYNTNLNRLQIGSDRWTSRLLKTVRRHKLITTVIISLMIFGAANVIMIYNFMKILDNTKTRGKRNVLSFVVDSGSMNSYSGFYGNSLQPSTAFDFMFMNGEHGHDKKGFEGKHHWMMHRSLPPYMYVERDIESGFGGRLDKIVNNRIEEILRK